MYENIRDPPGAVGGVGWSGVGESAEDPGWNHSIVPVVAQFSSIDYLSV